MLTDEAKIEVTAGKGGDGVVAFDKVKMALGPTGGRGGDGGDVYFQGVADIFALNKYRHLKKHFAQDGKNGRGNRGDGPGGQELILTVPLGTVITNVTTGKKYEIVAVGQKILAAKGGTGGRGNFYFRSSTNTSPQEFEEGKKGESFKYSFELRLIADAGLIGLPSAGKSSLLNELTAANAKVGAYHFTTLEPNLGVMDKIILADIPGLIEGASEGRGLGIKFLRHIRRTKVLIHCISLESEDVIKDYEVIRKELGKFANDLLEKEEVIVLTKTDLADAKKIETAKKLLKKHGEVMAVSIHDLDSLKVLEKKIKKMIAT